MSNRIAYVSHRHRHCKCSLFLDRRGRRQRSPHRVRRHVPLLGLDGQRVRTERVHNGRGRAGKLNNQCDQIGQFIGLWETFQSLW